MKSYFSVLDDRCASLPPGHEFVLMATEMKDEIKSRDIGGLCSAACEFQAPFLKYMATGATSPPPTPQAAAAGAATATAPQAPAAPPVTSVPAAPSASDALSPPQDTAEEAAAAAPAPGHAAAAAAAPGTTSLYCVCERGDVNLGGCLSLLELSCSRRMKHITKHRLPCSPCDILVMNIGANFVRSFQERYPKDMGKKNPSIRSRVCSIGVAWACEMYCWRVVMDAAKKEQEEKNLRIYTGFGHSETFGLMKHRDDTTGEFDGAFKRVIAAYERAREECAFEEEVDFYKDKDYMEGNGGPATGHVGTGFQDEEEDEEVCDWCDEDWCDEAEEWRDEAEEWCGE